MTYGYQIPARRGYTYARHTTRQSLETRKKLARQRAIKRALHFVGFLCYWAIILAAAYLSMLAFMITMVLLSH